MTGTSGFRSGIAAEVRKVWDAHLALYGVVKQPDVAREAADRLLKDDGFVQQVLRQLVVAACYTATRVLVASGRQQVDPEVLARKRRPGADPWARWRRHYEHAAIGQFQLPEMRAPELEQAAAERRARGETELAVAEFLDAIRLRLDGDERVSAAFRPEQLDRLYQRIVIERQAA